MKFESFKGTPDEGDPENTGEQNDISESSNAERDVQVEHQKEEVEKLSRFGGKAGKIARVMLLATALAFGAYEAVHHENIGHGGQKIESAAGEHNKKVEQEFILRGDGTVIEKKHIPAENGVEKGMALGNMALGLAISDSEKWILTVSIDGKETVVDVTEKQFDAYQAGDKIHIEVPRHGAGTVQHIGNTQEPTK